MSRKVYSLKSLSLLLIVNTSTVALGFSLAYRWTRPRVEPVPNSSSAALLNATDKDRDGLVGPVHQVRTEAARFVNKSGKPVEGPRQLMELTTYGARGDRVENSYYLVRGSSSAGREEYEYDEQGNITAMTGRDAQDSILNRETYKYEYDSAGNWTKMIAYAAILEGGRSSSRPVEVTYRNITYYSDKAIAERLEQSPPPGAIADENRQAGEESVESSREESQGSGGIESRATFASLRRALEGWVAANNARDIEKHISFYGSKLYSYYRARNVSREFVRADKGRMFQRADLVDVRAGAPEIVLDRDNRTAMMRFRKQYLVRSGRLERSGEVLQELRWQRTPEDGWEIISERDTRVFR